MAEREGFEPSKGYKPLLVFKTSAFNRSATSPVFQWLCDGAFCLLFPMDSTGDVSWDSGFRHYSRGIIEIAPWQRHLVS
jgi:hypothetical protein